jgi:hypothetical protein
MKATNITTISAFALLILLFSSANAYIDTLEDCKKVASQFANTCTDIS